MNDYKLTPIHCAASSTDDEEVFALLHAAAPEAVKQVDGKGRTCLHVAVLRIGADDLERRKEEELMQAAEGLSLQAGDDEETHGHCTHHHEEEEEDEYEGREGMKDFSHPLSSSSSLSSRKALYFLISIHPQALVTPNNFLLPPVETALERIRAENKRLRTISVYGLYDDPLTARILLIAHKMLYKRGVLSNCPLSLRHQKSLRELNWSVRKDFVFASLVGSAGRTHHHQSNGTQGSKSGRDGKSSKHGNSNKGGGSSTPLKTTAKLLSSSAKTEGNILARLRWQGGFDCLPIIASFI